MFRLASLTFATLAVLSLALAFEFAPAFAQEKPEKEEAELAGKVYTLIKDKCWSCHGEPGKKVFGKIGGEPFNFILDYDLLIENGMIDKERPELSEIYSSMKTGAMPREVGNVRAKKKLPQDDIDMVLNWIKAGAPKWDATAIRKTAPKVAWAELKVGGPHPRCRFAMADGPKDTIVLFGGYDGASVSDQTWVFAKGAWNQAAPKTNPLSVIDATMAFDKTRGVNVMFGLAGNTWEWDGTDWKEIKTATAPGAREACSMAFDPNLNVILLYGGQGPNGTPLMHDLWSFDGKEWVQLPIKDGPEARSGAAMCYSPASKAILLFGGRTAGGLAADTWLFNGKAWAKQSPVATPQAADSLLMAASTVSAVLLTSRPGDSSSDTWLWDGKDWAKVEGGPKARTKAGIAFDAKTKGIVVFGGQVRGTHLGDTWTLGPAK